MSKAPTQPTKVFLSYASDDRELAESLKEVLKQEGIEVWDGQATIQVGENIRYEVQKAVDSADAVVFQMSPSWSTSARAQAELGAALASRAHDARKKILPVLLDKAAEPSPWLSSHFFLDLSDPRTRQTKLVKLVEALKTPSEPAADDELATELNQLDSQHIILQELEDSARSRYASRERPLRIALLISLIVSVSAVVVASVTGSFPVSAGILGPLVGLVGAMIGFYFGRQKS
jgi:hypothetical protein